MIEDSTKLQKGQKLKIEINHVIDRVPKNIIETIRKDPIAELIGYKMVDGNQFGLVLKLNNGDISWFFEKELSELV